MAMNPLEQEALEEAERQGYEAGRRAVQKAIEAVMADLPPAPVRICGVVLPNAGPHGEPVACAWQGDHLPESPHSWAWVPTFTREV